VAVPVNDGAVTLDGDSGWSSVTVGEFVSTVKVTGGLLPVGFPSELGWYATAVYWPFDRSGVTVPEVQLPPVPAALAVDTGVPSVFVPEYTLIVTRVVSLPVPVKEGVVSLERTAGDFNVTVGGAVLTVNATWLLTPAGFPRELSCVAIAL
jgi:hypothetical protein